MNRKRNRKAIIITAIVMLLGILLVLAGVFGGWFMGLFYEDFDYKNIKPEDLGKTINTDIQVYYEDIDLPDKTLQVVGSISDEDARLILFDVSALSEADKSSYYSKSLQYITITGTLRAVDDAEYKELSDSVFRFYEEAYYEILDREGQEDAPEKREYFYQMMMEPVIPYCIEVKSIEAFNWIPFIAAGILVFVVSFILEICLVFKLKKRIVLPIVYGLMIVVPAIMFFNHIRTMLSVNKESDSLYVMKNYECTDTKAMLDSNSDSANSFLSWVLDNHMYGMPNFFNIDKSHVGFGCATFAAVTPEGEHVFGRNFDLMETDALLIYSHPEGAYESIGIADIGIFGVSQSSAVSPDSPLGKFIMVMMPYFVVDGMNEKGVGAGILQLTIEEPHQDNGKPDLLVFCAIRGILDYCASVDEALVLLESYDIHSDLGNYHLFITDKSGRYVVVEWLDGEMVVTEHPCCTNSVIAPGEFYDMGDPDSRKGTIESCLGSDHVVTEEEAMEILDKVHNKRMTEWSCVYNLEDFTVSICLDADYSKVYTFCVEDLRS
jgi:hypothetical protein